LTSSPPRRGKSLFITFEGGEGAGKSTQAAILTERVRTSGREALSLREPGGTPLGERLRDLLLHGEGLSPETELLLFLAARAQLVASVIQPALDRGAIVICDRFSDSTVAYQGYGRGLDLDAVRSLDAFATGGLEPDLTFFLGLSSPAGLARKAGEEDAFQNEELAFHERVQAGYRASGGGRARWHEIDASRDIEGISALIWEVVGSRVA